MTLYAKQIFTYFTNRRSTKQKLIKIVFSNILRGTDKWIYLLLLKEKIIVQFKISSIQIPYWYLHTFHQTQLFYQNLNIVQILDWFLVATWKHKSCIRSNQHLSVNKENNKATKVIKFVHSNKCYCLLNKPVLVIIFFPESVAKKFYSMIFYEKGVLQT